MKPYTRSDRVGELIRQVLADILQKDIKDPRLHMTTIAGVRMSSDLKLARIYFSVSGGEKRIQAAKEGFESAGGFIRRTIARELELRYMPELRYYYDESFDYGDHINKLLKTIHTKDGTDHPATETE